MGQVPTTSLLVLRMAARQIGVHSTEVPSTTPTNACNALHRLAKKGKLLRLDLGWRNVRYFTDQGALERYQAKFLEAKKSTPKLLPALGNAGWAPDAPIDYSRAVFTQCPSAPPRFQAVDYPGTLGLQRGRV